MAATKDLQKVMCDGKLVAYPVKGSTKIFAGTMVCVDATGYAIPAADAAGNRFVGVAEAQADNALGSDGDINVLVWKEGDFEFAASSITQAMVGAQMHVVDDMTFDETTPAHTVPCGTLAKYISATKGVLSINKTAMAVGA
jgi:hypothetical protein